MKRPWNRSAHVLIALVLLLQAACTSVRARMPDESSIPYMKEALDRARVLPSRTFLVPGGDAGGQPIEIAIHETGTGDRDRLVILLHGLLSDSRTWRFMRGDLGESFDLWAVDLLGCGESGKPDPEAAGPDGYGPSALGRHVLLALRQALAHRRTAPADITLVGHSLGGMTILRMYADPALREGFGDVLSRVNRLVLLAPVDVAVEKLHPDFLAIAETSGLLIEVGSLLGIVTETCAAAMRGGGNDPDGVPVEEADKLADVMRNGATRRAAQAMILQAVPFVPKEGKLRPDWDRIDAIVAGYANVKVPALILWGRRDETFPVSMGFKLAAELPDARLRVLPLTMHSPTWERPRVCTTLIREFIQADGRTSPRVAEVDLRSYDAVASAGGAN